MMRPCLGCGEPTTASRCPACRPAKPGKDRTHVHSNTTRWKNLSQRLRKASPSCEWCGTTDALTLDHVIPVSITTELAYAVENCRVLCKSCNGRRGNTYTTDEARQVLTRLQATYARKPTRKGRERVNAAQQAVQALGGSPEGVASPAYGKASSQLHTGGYVARRS